MNCVIDASVTLALFLPDEDEPSAALTETLLRKEAVVPAHWPFEVANGFLIASRRGRITAEEMVAMLGDVAALSILPDRTDQIAVLVLTLDLAVLHRLTVYDAAYLELALRRRLPLATLDARLRDAARREGVVLF